MTVEQRIGGAAPSGLPFPELRAGNLGVRIAATPAEIDAVQALRYRVFYRELGATADDEAARTGRDRDGFDAVADHLLVVDHAIGAGAEGVVGTYRLIQREAAARARPVLFRRRIRHPPDPGAFPGASWNSAAPASMPPTATAPPCSCCGAASPPMCSTTRST